MDRAFLTGVFRFIVVGVVSTALNYIVFYVLYKSFHINYIVSSASGYIAGLILGFFLNHFWTFESQKVESRKVIGYIAVYAFSLALSSLFLWVAVSKLHNNALIANFVAICITTASNFIGLKFIIYKIDESEPN